MLGEERSADDLFWAKLMMIFVALRFFFREDGPFSVSSMRSFLSPWAKRVAD
jgi:hypothetical protein